MFGAHFPLNLNSIKRLNKQFKYIIKDGTLLFDAQRKYNSKLFNIKNRKFLCFHEYFMNIN